MNEELGFESSGEKEVTSEEIAAACRGYLDPEDCEELAAMDSELALENAFLWLIQSPQFNGDPEELLRDKGVLE